MKKTVLLFLGALLTLSLLNAQSVKIPVVNVTEVAGATPGMPRGQIDRLIDGKKMQFVFWPTWNRKRQPHIDLYFNLQSAAEISSLEFQIFRRGKDLNEYNAKTLELYVENANGKYVPAATDHNPPVIKGARGAFRLKVNNVKGKRFKLRVAGVKYIALCEVTFYGKMAAGYKAPEKMKNYLSAVRKGVKGLSLRKIVFDHLRGVEYVVESPEMLWVITPERGGMLNFVYDKTNGKNFVKSRRNKETGGMLGDKFQYGSIPQHFRLYNSSYKCDVVKNTPHEIVLRLSINAATTLPGPVMFSREYVFRKNSSSLEIRHSVSNDGRNVVPYNEPLTFHSFLMTKGEMKRFCFKADGPHFSSAGFSLDVPDTVNGHAGVLDSDGDGLAVLHDFRDTALVRYWSANRESSTVEVLQGLRPVTADRKEECTLYLVPVRKIKEPHGTFPEGTAGFTVRGRKLFLNIAFTDKKVFTGKALYPLTKKVIYSGKIGKTTCLTDTYDGGSVVVILKSGDVERRIYFKGKDKFKIPAEYRNVRPVPSMRASYGKVKLDFTSEEIVIDDGPVVPAALRQKKVWFNGQGYFWCREAVEFARRSGAHISVFPVGKIFRLGENSQELSVSNSSAVWYEALKKADFNTLVVMGFAWKNLPANLKKKVLERVKKGAGLVLIAPDPDKKIVKGGRIVPVAGNKVFDGIPLELLPECDLFASAPGDARVLVRAGKLPLISARSLGKGRIVEIHWNSFHRVFVRNKTLGIGLTLPAPEAHRWQLQMVSRAIMYASQAEWKNAPVLKVHNGKLFIAAIPGKAQIEIVFRSAFDRALQRVKVTGAAAGKGIPFPGLAHTAEVQIINGKQIWNGGAVLNTNKSTLKLSFDKELWNVQEELPVVFKSTNMPAGTVYMLRLTDSFDRVFFEGAVANGQKTALKKGMGTAFNVELWAEKDGRLLASDTRWLYFDTRHDRNIFTVDYGWPSFRNHGMVDYLIPRFAKQLQKIGINASSQFNIDNPHSRTMRLTRQAGMTTPVFGGYGKPGISRPVTNADSPDKFKWIRKVCPNSPRVQRDEVAKAGTMRPLEEISLGRTGVDELHAYVNDWDGCYCKYCLAGMRDFLRKKYGNLETLNRVWKSNFTRWEDVSGDSLKEARKKKHFVSWLDHREFQAISLTEAQGKLLKARRKYDPEAFIAMCGTQDMTPFRALDWAELMKDCGGIYSYLRSHSIMQRSFLPAGKRVFWLQWTGYYYPAEILARRLAMHMALGGSGAVIYCYYYVNPDFSLNSYSRGLERLLKPYHKGAGAVLAQSADTLPQTALLYDPRGFYLNYALGFPELSEKTASGFDTALSDIAADYYWTKIDGISRFKVIIVPAVDTLSASDVRKLEEFVRKGGTLLSVLSSGRYDGNGYPVQPQLDKLLGIDSSKGALTQGTFRLQAQKEIAGFNNFGIRNAVLKVKATSARVLARINGSPVVTVQNYGKGKAIYFGCDFWSTYGNLSAMRNFPQFAALRKNVQQYLNSLIRERKLRVFNGSEEAVGVRMIERKVGDASVFCCLDYLDGDFGKGMPVFNEANPVLTFKSSQKAWFYDLFTRKKLGEGKAFRSNLKHMGNTLYVVMLPSAPEELKLGVTETGARSWQVSISGNSHPVKITLFAGAKELPAYRKFLVQGDKRVFEFHLGLNDPAGIYTIKVEDLLSDKEAKAEFKVK